MRWLADDLHLQMPCRTQICLGEYRRVAEGQLRFRGALTVGIVDLAGARHLAHAPATTAGKRLDHDRAADLSGEEVPDVAEAAGALGRRQHRQPGGDGGGAGRRLVPDHLQHLGVGSHERVPGASAGPSEFGVLAEEPVARVDQLGAGRLGRGQDGRSVEVGVDPVAGQGDCLVGRVHVWAVGVVRGVNGHRGDVQFGCRADDSKRYFAPVRDQQAHSHTPAIVTRDHIPATLRPGRSDQTTTCLGITVGRKPYRGPA
ncbi:hypothetical protein NIIDMKKI_47390 [Mycobacterium kansasii]|uniref:Uncharacterized protein n=1 Tax=Mycobacterium kansasii TaxID=1768 RepID=A0A7G1IH91_MYCKA|nr:hypothetical protein NIIDMKKI_47390 [Mycobacterium kansasii]